MSHAEAVSPQICAAGVANVAELARLSAQLGYPSDAAAMRQRLKRLAARPDHAVFVANTGDGASLAAERCNGAAGFERIVVRSNAVRPEAHSFYASLEYTLEKTQRVYGKVLTP